MRNLVIVGIAAFLIGATGSWWVTTDYKEAQHAAAVAKADKANNALLQKKTEEVIKAERRAIDLNNKLEKVYAKEREAIDAVFLADLTSVGRSGGLCDWGRGPGSGGALPPVNPASDPAGASARCPRQLSDEASRFLLALAREADAVAAYAQLCHSWVVEDRGVSPKVE